MNLVYVVIATYTEEGLFADNEPCADILGVFSNENTARECMLLNEAGYNIVYIETHEVQ